MIPLCQLFAEIHFVSSVQETCKLDIQITQTPKGTSTGKTMEPITEHPHMNILSRSRLTLA